MEPLDPSKATALHWVRTSGHALGYELRDEETPVASLYWRRYGGSLAEAEVAGDSWSLKRVGFLHPVVTARRKGAAASDAARLTVHWRRNAIEIAGKSPSFLERAGVSIPAWQQVDSLGKRMFHVEPVAEGGRLAGGTVSIDPPGRASPDLLLLLVLAWHFVVMYWTEEELAAATSAALVALY